MVLPKIVKAIGNLLFIKTMDNAFFYPIQQAFTRDQLQFVVILFAEDRDMTVYKPSLINLW